MTVDSYIIEWFNSGFGTNDTGMSVLGNICLIILSLILTALFTGFIGWERESHGHAAGLRTHLLIAVGSALVMIVSVYGFSVWDSDPDTTRDPARLAAQVISGIGFLGAGTIVQNGLSVRGLTTATTLWVSMAIGLACGSGNFVIAAIATLVSLLSLVAMRKLEKRAGKRNPLLIIVFPSTQAVTKDVIETAERYGINIRDSWSEIMTYQEQSAIRMVIRLSTGNPSAITSFTDELRLIIRPLELKVTTEN